MDQTAATNWLKLLHGYAPGIRNQATLAEKIAKLEKRTKTPRIQFDHPASSSFFEALIPSIGEPVRNIMLLGTAGDGKTSLMMEGKMKISSIPANTEGCLESFDADTKDGLRHFIFIYDLSGWRGEDPITPEQLDIFYQFADAVAGKNNNVFVVAANDGALHQILLDDIPEDAPETARTLKETINNLHSTSRSLAADAIAPSNLRLINLSLISSEQIMRECLKAILERKEWQDPAFGNGTGILAPNSPVVRNFKLINSETVRNRLITLAKLADACGFHLSIRDLLCLIVNAILGHPKANKGVLSPNAEGDTVVSQHPDGAPLHRLVFGDSLPESSRNTRMCYVFLSLLQIGRETTNELDDLLIFGGIDQEDPELKKKFDLVVTDDPLKQRDPYLLTLAKQYVTGDMDDQDQECAALRSALTNERKRLFLNTPDATFKELKMWNCTAFHHAGRYLEEILDKLRNNGKPSPSLLRKIVGGLNRIWTGFLLNTDSDALYLCTGLDVTTAPVSDLFLRRVEIDGFDGEGIHIDLDRSRLPRLVFKIPGNDKEFSFRLTLQRFEFLMRVANGAMPTSFSRESAEDFAVLKQRCIRDLCSTNTGTIRRVAPDSSGGMGFEPIHFQ